jgi:hypothetical protein
VCVRMCKSACLGWHFTLQLASPVHCCKLRTAISSLQVMTEGASSAVDNLDGVLVIDSDLGTAIDSDLMMVIDLDRVAAVNLDITVGAVDNSDRVVAVNRGSISETGRQNNVEIFMHISTHLSLKIG